MTDLNNSGPINILLSSACACGAYFFYLLEAIRALDFGRGRINNVKTLCKITKNELISIDSCMILVTCEMCLKVNNYVLCVCV